MTELDESYLMDHPDSTEEIPTLDIAPFLAGEPGARERIGKQLAHISETVGFFYLSGHDVPQSIIDATFGEIERFSALPGPVKEAIPRRRNVGYLRKGGGVSKNSRIIDGARPDLVESFLINRDRTPDDPAVIADKPFRALNFWPPEDAIPGFRAGVVAYFNRIEQLGKRFVPLWEAALGLPAGFFGSAFDEPMMTFRMSHYPPQKEVGNKQFGIAPHTDNAMMTLLPQTKVPGLAVRMPSGHWRVAETVPGTFLVNTGNLMVRWTNNRFLSTKHCVINSSGKERFSIPMFFGPNPDTLIECVPTCVSADNPAQYEPATYEDIMLWYFDNQGKNPMTQKSGGMVDPVVTTEHSHAM
jgi:isopenicillin N synthase-like dioxygenase